jgi:chromosome segregation ATPase
VQFSCADNLLFYRNTEKIVELYKESGTYENRPQSEIEIEYKTQIQNLENELKVVKRQTGDQSNKAVKEKAVLEQRITFLEQEKQENFSKLQERANHEESLISMIKKRYDEEYQDHKHEFIETLDLRNSEISELKSTIDKLKDHYEEELKSTKHTAEEVISEYTSRLSDFEKIIEVKNKRIDDLELQIVKVRSNLNNEKERKIEELQIENDELTSKIDQLETDLATSKLLKAETSKINTETEEKIKQIKDVYEAEKKKYQKTLKEIRKDNEEEIKLLQEEFDEKLSQHTTQHEEEIDLLQSQLNQVNEEKAKLQHKNDDLMAKLNSVDKSLTTYE